MGPGGEKVSWHWQENGDSAMTVNGVAASQKREGKLIWWCLLEVSQQLYPLVAAQMMLEKKLPDILHTHWGGIIIITQCM